LRSLTLLAVFFLAAAALAQNEPAAVLHARVSSVDGNVIHVANGLIAVDASHAKIVWNGNPATIAAVTKDALVTATLKGTAFPANSTLPATSIYVVRRSDVQLAGPVSAVDAAHGTLTVLGITVAVDAKTSFDANVKRLADVKPAQILSVDANRSGKRLLAITVAAMLEEPDVKGMENLGAVGGYVSSNDGNLVRLADGLIAIDPSGAEIRGSLRPGSHILANVKPATVVPRKPLLPWMIGTDVAPDVSMNGAVTAADPANRTFTLLGQTIRMDAATDVKNVELERGALLLVSANRSGDDLVATFVSSWIPELD
jgi:hypothetical protein